MDYDNGNYGNTPNLESINMINKIKIKNDGQSRLSDLKSGALNPNLSSFINSEITRIKEKKIVNNKPSQFGPVMGVNFHNERY